jgi:hypothetical protein
VCVCVCVCVLSCLLCRSTVEVKEGYEVLNAPANNLASRPAIFVVEPFFELLNILVSTFALCHFCFVSSASATNNTNPTC